MDLRELATVRISPFEVSTERDEGYRAANSVSASRLDTPISDLPFAVQAFTSTFIADQRPENLFDVARYAPGVTYRSNDFNEGNANLAIRGFSIGSLPGSPQVLRDGFRGPSIVDFTNIERVEVVKGPSSFLYGQLAPGGVVNVLTKRPQKAFAATGRVGYGSYGGYRLDADVTGPATPHLFYRTALSYDQDMRYWKPYDAHSTGFAPSLLWEPADRASISLKYERFRKREAPQVMQKPAFGPQASLVPTPSDPNLLGIEPDLPNDWNSMSETDFRDSDTDSFQAVVRMGAGQHWDVRAGASHNRYTIGAVFSGNLGLGNKATFLQGRRVRRQTYENHDDTFEVEATGKYVLGGTSVRLLAGGQLIWGRFDATAGQAPNDPSLGSDPTASPLPLWDLRNPATWDRTRTIPIDQLNVNTSDTTIRSEDRAAYVGTTVGVLDDSLLILAGLRRTQTYSRNTDRTIGVIDRFTTHRATPQYGVLYKLHPDLFVFASYAESFVPNPNVLKVRSVPTTPAGPAEGHGYDIGCNLVFDRLSGTVTVFEAVNKNIVNDIAVLDPVTGFQVFTNVQSGKQRSRGLEVDVTMTPALGWQVYASYSFMRARVLEFSGQDAALLASDPATLDAAERVNYRNAYRFHGAPLQMSAPHLFNVWTRYDVSDGTLKGLYVAGGANVVRDQTLLPDSPPASYQDYTLVNTLVGYSWTWQRQRLSVDLVGKNLRNAHYRPSQSTRARPRELFVTLSTSF